MYGQKLLRVINQRYSGESVHEAVRTCPSKIDLLACSGRLEFDHIVFKGRDGHGTRRTGFQLG